MALLLINSCRKDRQNLPLTKTELITEARSFFEDEIVNLPKLNDNNVRHSLNKAPLWDKASIRKISIGDAVIVPIKYDYEMLLKPENDKTFNSLGKSSYLMIYKNKQQELQVEWVTFIPDEKDRSKDFIGTIAIEDWNGKFKRGFAFGADGDIIPIYSNKATTYRKVAFARSVYCFTMVYYGYVMDYPQVIGTETFCFNTGSGNDDPIPMRGDGNNGGGGPSPNDYVPDCDGVIGSGATWIESCETCIGGNTGLSACPPEDPCAKKGALQTQINNAVIDTLKTKILAKTDGKEWGAKQSLNSLSMTSGYKTTPLLTNGAVDYVNIGFSWNATEGYSIGSVHNHPSGNAPSYDDVFKMVSNLSEPGIAASGLNGINFYKNNVSTTIVTSSGTYVVTVKNWQELNISFGNWVANPNVFEAEYNGAAAEYLIDHPTALDKELSEFALLAILSKGINLYKTEPNSNILKPLIAYINSDNKLTLASVNCP